MNSPFRCSWKLDEAILSILSRARMDWALDRSDNLTSEEPNYELNPPPVPVPAPMVRGTTRLLQTSRLKRARVTSSATTWRERNQYSGSTQLHNPTIKRTTFGHSRWRTRTRRWRIRGTRKNGDLSSSRLVPHHLFSGPVAPSTDPCPDLADNILSHFVPYIFNSPHYCSYFGSRYII